MVSHRLAIVKHHQPVQKTVFFSFKLYQHLEAETLQSLVELVDSLPDVVVRTWDA